MLDTSETLLAGRVVFLDTDGDGVLDGGETRTGTGADGSYAFDNLAAGNYRVVQETPAGWMLTSPNGGGFSLALGEGQTLTGRNFANFQTGTLSGVKFHDLDADGVHDASEPLLAGWTIFLDADSDGVLDSDEQSRVTGGDGGFSFTGVHPGLFSVGEVQQAGWARTTTSLPYSVNKRLRRHHQRRQRATGQHFRPQVQRPQRRRHP